MTRFSLVLLLSLTAFAQKKPVTLDVAARPPAPKDAVGSIVWAPDSRAFVWIGGKSLYLYDVAAKSRKKVLDLDPLERSASKSDAPRSFEWDNRRIAEQRIQWTPDSRKLVLLVEGDLFLYDIAGSSQEQLTTTSEAERDPKVSPDGKLISYTKGNEVYVLDLATKKSRRLTHDATATVWNGRPDWVYPEELDLGSAHWWSPDSTQIAFLQFDISRVGIYPHSNLLETQAVYEPQRYPKAGTPNPDVRLGVIDVGAGKLRWIDLGDTRDALLARIDWLPDSRQIAVQRLNRVQNRLALLFADAGSGTAKTILTETDPYWVNVSNDLYFLKNRREFIWSSERTGFRHLYVHNYEGKRERALTSGEWEVKGLASVDEDKGVAYYHSRQHGALGADLASVSLRGGKSTRITDGRGMHTVELSPDHSVFLDTFGSLTEPTRRTLRRINGDSIDTIQPPNPAADEHEFIKPEIVRVKTKDGAMLYARLLKPAGFDPARKYPAIVSVYGGPHAQMVCECYSGLSYDQYLAQNGYVVWSMDNRGTAGRGHAFEAKLYRRFGKQELADQLEGVDHLIGMGFVDPQRIGIHGWSYGGFLTLYALMHAPDRFRAGIAGAPVVDWRLYDTIYTERYLGLPQENEQGYRESSPVHYADKLQAPLLLLHNFEDDNVLFQNAMQMMAALQKAGKQYESLIYPQRTHGVTGPARKHMLEAMTTFFHRHLKSQPGNGSGSK